jgi:hypothetical protein
MRWRKGEKTKLQNPPHIHKNAPATAEPIHTAHALFFIHLTQVLHL